VADGALPVSHDMAMRRGRVMDAPRRISSP
jgi:hypothetical protein